MKSARLVTVIAVFAALLAPSAATAGIDEATIQGRVTNTSGLGVESACVGLFVGDDVFDATETTVEGGFEFTVPSGDYLLYIADCIFTDYFAEWYDDVHPAEAADAAVISVGSGDVRVVDVVLADIFADVEKDTSFTDHIIFIRDIGVTNGCGGNNYCPKDSVTREQMAAFLARMWRLFGGDCPDGPMPFVDVPLNSFAYDDIRCIVNLNLTTGTAADLYSPDDSVSRAQMAAFIARFWRAGGETCPDGVNPFGDVESTRYYHGDVICIFLLDITTGTSPNTFSPFDDVTREQMAAFLSRLARAIDALAPS